MLTQRGIGQVALRQTETQTAHVFLREAFGQFGRRIDFRLQVNAQMIKTVQIESRSRPDRGNLDWPESPQIGTNLKIRGEKEADRVGTGEDDPVEVT